MIILIQYDPAWPNLFEAEKRKLLNAVSDVVVEIEHIGSTAIPGIHAKPIIDILIGVKDLGQFTNEHIQKIESLGYKYIKDYEEQLPHRRYFQKQDQKGRVAYHIHLVNYSSAWWERHILFRDYLKEYPDEAKRYDLHKLKLAKEFDDSNQYAMAKNQFCRGIDKEAYFDFKIHKPFVVTERLNGYIPDQTCFEIYSNMFHDPEFIHCYGIELTDERIKKILERVATHWDQFQFAPLVWLDKKTNDFVGEGGLNHTKVEGKEEIELTYSLSKAHWGKGFAVEIGQYAIDYAFKIVKLENIVCFTMPKNYQSLRVMEKLNFQYEKDFIHAELLHKLYRLRISHYLR